MDFRLHEPLWLLLLIPIMLYFGWQVLKKYKQWTTTLKIAFVLRIITVVCLIVAMAAPYMLQQADNEQVVFLMDRSASVAAQEQALTNELALAIQQKKDDQQVKIYSFGENFQTEQLIEGDEGVQPFHAFEGRAATNIEQAIRYAQAASDKNVATRFVLVSDGLETRGNAQDAALLLQGSNATLDALPIMRQIDRDVALQQFTTPQNAVLGEEITASLQIYASSEQQITVQLAENDAVVATKQVALVEGFNDVHYTLRATAQGLVQYEATIVAPGDTLLDNNQLVSLTQVGDTPHVLVVQHDTASTLPALIQQSGLIVDTAQATSLPTQLVNYVQYDAIIFDNVPGYVVGEQKMQLIQQAVETFGTGFLMVGGQQSFGLGGYYKTPIEEILPVKMEVTGDHQLPSLGLMIVMDRSGSMSDGKLALAKEAAVRSVELLREEDHFGFIAFDDRPWEIIEMAQLGENRQEAMDKILSVGVGGGTEIYTSLAAAYSKLAEADVQRKHIILLTDGQSATNASYEELITQPEHADITLSTVAIGADADKVLLEELGNIGKGRYYEVLDANMIPSILSRETVMVTRTYIEDTPFIPQAYKSKWDAVFAQGMPQMNAYIATTAKPTAQVIVESDKQDPILVTGKAGLGKTMAFTSDSSGAWAGDWAASNFWPQFWRTNLTELLPSYQTAPYTITHNQDGSFTLTDPSNQAAFLTVTAVADNGEQQQLTTELQAPNELRLTTDAKPGILLFSVQGLDGELSQIGLTIPYSEEYKVAATDAANLEAIANNGNGQVIESFEQAFRDMDNVSAVSTPLAQMLLLVAMLLFFIDIALRRFGLPMFKRRQPIEQLEPEEESSVQTIIKGLKR